MIKILLIDDDDKYSNQLKLRIIDECARYKCQVHIEQKFDFNSGKEVFEHWDRYGPYDMVIIDNILDESNPVSGGCGEYIVSMALKRIDRKYIILCSAHIDTNVHDTTHQVFGGYSTARIPLEIKGTNQFFKGIMLKISMIDREKRRQQKHE